MPLTKRKPSLIVDAGAGKIPTALLKKAMKSSGPNATKLQKRRFFFGVDKTFDLNSVIKRLGIKKPLKNISLVESCAVQAISLAEPGSIKIIFESFLLNNLERMSCLASERISCQNMFLAMSKRALRPGGRLILVHTKGSSHIYRALAQDLGMGFHSMEIPDNVSKKSHLKAVRIKSTSARRKKYIDWLKNNGSLTTAEINESLKKNKIKTVDGYATPTVSIFRKARKGEKIKGGRLHELSKTSSAELKLLSSFL